MPSFDRRLAALRFGASIFGFIALVGIRCAAADVAPGPNGPRPVESFTENSSAPQSEIATLELLEPVVVQARVTGRSGAGSSLRGVLSPERAQRMLRSLTLPGWGQAAAGRPGAARTFAWIDAGIWTSYVAFQIQAHLRTESALHTARLFAGIDLRSRGEEYRRIVGLYSSSEEYNRLVVARDAANLYYGNPAAYQAYIASHSISGSGGWSWTDFYSFDRYRSQRKSSERAGLRANTSLALAIANRIVSAVHAAGSNRPSAAKHAWRLDFAPGDPAGDEASRLALSLRF